MNECKLTVQQIRGLILASANKDVRYYLNGTLFDFDKARAVSIDGTCLLAVNLTECFGDGDCAGGIIIPRDSLELVAKGGRVTDSVTIRADSEGVTLERESGATVRCTPIDGKFPEYTRVMPTECSGELAQFNPDLVARISKALKQALDMTPSKGAWPYILHNGYAGAVVGINGREADAIAIVMPCKADEPKNSPVSLFLAEQSAERAVA